MSLANALLEKAQPRSIEKFKFLTALQNGVYPKSALKVLARCWFDITQSAPKTIANLIACCPNPNARLHFLENLLEEEGIVFSPETGSLKRIPERNHTEMLRRFAAALGISGKDLENRSDVTESTWTKKALREGRWQAAAAFLMVGFEANVPEMFRAMIPPLKKHYGFTDEDLQFFHVHVKADEIHSSRGAQLLEEVIESQKDKEEVLEGVRRGALSWWLAHKMMDRDMSKMTHEKLSA